ncbi:MAG: methyltransferase [Desulfocapsaceae bacterium]|nr:methyltransferase [Desulfocapsaceae bacterium]
MSVSSAYWRGCALQAGVRLEIFSILADEALPLSRIAERADSDHRGMEYLLNALSAMGLLDKQGDTYRNSRAALNFLCTDSRQYIGHIILHHHHILDGWAQLDLAVRTGQPVARRSYGAVAERESFLLGMFNLAMMIAPDIARSLDLHGSRRLLDLGGGPGTYAIHFCLANPDLQAVIFDRPTTQPFAQKTVGEFGLTDRIGFLGGDFNCDPIPGGPYDVAWLSQILHSNGPEQCREVIRKVVEVMTPGGLIMIHDFILEDSKDSPEFAALFALNMLVNNARGRTYSEQEIRAMLQEAGAGEIARHPFQGPNSSSILSARV